MEKTLILGECKWTRRLGSRRALSDLIEKANEFVPSQGRWQVHFQGFVREGWTQAAQDFAASISSESVPGANWQAHGIDLHDLGQKDNDLDAWTR